MAKKIFYVLVGLAAFFIVFQNVQSMAYGVWEWWEDRNYEYTPTYSTVAAPDAVQRPVRKVRPAIKGTVVSPLQKLDGGTARRLHLVIPTHLQFAGGDINPEAVDEIVVTGSKKSSLPTGLRLPKRSDRPVDEDGNITNKTRHPVQRACRGDTYTNLLLHDRVAHKTKPIFEAPLSVIGHQLITTNDQVSHILAFTAILDTNQDDKLTCQDFIHMAIFDIETDTLHWVEMGKSEPLVPDGQYGNSNVSLLRALGENQYVMGIGVDDNDDGLFDPKTEITEMAVLSIREKSFEKIVTAAHLKKVQDILYPVEQNEAE